MKLKSIRPEFVEFIPRQLEDGMLYISRRYKTASHLCACGCRQRVVTPFSPADWQLYEEGETISLHPSIGNWKYACQSHYLIRKNQIVWASQMSKQQIARVQARDIADTKNYIAATNAKKVAAAQGEGKMQDPAPHWSLGRIFRFMLRWWNGQ
jgi:hypothetical protein